MVTKTIAIIPARGGSKRILNKNIIDFGGKPLISWTIKAAISSKLFDRVIVSTDSQKIAEISKLYGAEVPFLRSNHADDHAPVSLATLDALTASEAWFGEKYQHVVQMMPNCPLRNEDDILNSYKKFITRCAPFQLSCFRYGFMNPWWAMMLNTNGVATKINEDKFESRSQDLENLYCPTGAIWIAECEAFKKEKSFYGKGHVFSELSLRSSIDIDDAQDLLLARAFLQLQ